MITVNHHSMETGLSIINYNKYYDYTNKYFGFYVPHVF